MTINTEKDTFVEYSHNNSGGSDWIDANGWKALEAAGWELERFDDGRPYMARRAGLDLKEAVDEWSNLTGAYATDAGCPCCGQPHRFTFYKDGEYVTSGPSVHFTASWE